MTNATRRDNLHRAELLHTEAGVAGVQTKGSRWLQITLKYASILTDVNDDNQTESIEVEMDTKLKKKKSPEIK